MSNIHRIITLAVVTVGAAIPLSTIASAQDNTGIGQDAKDIQQDRQDTSTDTQRLFRDAVQGGSIDRDLRRLREDSQNTAEDNARFKRDVDRQVGDPGDVDAMARTRSAPMNPQAVTKGRPQGLQK